jgi:hypothetical protein
MRPTLRATVVGLVVVTAAMIGIFVVQSGSSSARSLGEAPQAPPRSTPSVEAVPGGELGRSTKVDGALTRADGVLPDGATVFDDEDPGIARLGPDLLYALRVAASKAADDGIELTINSGWRSRTYQDALLRAAISEYGSLEEAERWVASADTSPHVSGDAVDIGSAGGTKWLSKNGAAYGLCQIYRNEPWHFELRSEAIKRGCPRMYADPTHDPRMQK